MPAAPNPTKDLLDALKGAGLKLTTKQPASKRMTRIYIDDKCVAHVFPIKDGVRVYVRTASLPAKLLRLGFTETRDSGFALTPEDDKQLEGVVAAISHASETNAKEATKS